MAAMLWVAFLMAPGLPALATECLMIGKVIAEMTDADLMSQRKKPRLRDDVSDVP
eukprot:Skav215776  [mRNA]  locus=scaffold2278:111259:115950:+ [translate_table: standard]